MAHKLAQPYSGKSPVPKVTTQFSSLLNPEHATEAKAQQLQDQSKKREEKQTEKRADRLSKGYVMHVNDPTTGEEMDIRNADEEPDLHTKGMNVLNSPFPPPDWAQHRVQMVSATLPSIIYIATAYTLCTLLALFIPVSNTIVSSLWLIPPTILTYCLLFRLRNVSDCDFDDRSWHAERMRGLKAGSDVDGDGQVSDEERTRESAEWANTLLRGVWPIINSDLFAPAVDMLEDIMQSSIPKFVYSVRISDMALGSNAGRITAIRSLPDAQETDEMHSTPGALGVDMEHLDDQTREALGGNHVNLEVSFAYRGLPSGQSAESKAQNIHMTVEFFVGLKGVYGVKVPVWVEVTGAVGTARARLQLISNPPFVKTTLVSLMGLPHITISVIALSRVLPNVMNLPFISGFISSAINTAAAEYVAPKSLTLDLQQLISGDDIKKDTETVGVLVVHIHRATGVKGMDADGGSDPYVTLTYSQLGKPLYSTRIIKGDCNPVFEETAVVLVDITVIRLREKLSFQLWDSDRMSADDMLGLAKVEIMDLMRQNGTPTRHISPLSSPDSRDRPGSIEYTIGYYGKRQPSSNLATDGADPGVPQDIRDSQHFKESHGVALNDLESAVLVIPPDSEWPSGILAIQIHEIQDLMVKREGRERKGGKARDGAKGQDAGAQVEEEGEGLPSSYCTISLNDELIYETRVKPITSCPMFYAGAERFVRDWRTAHVIVAVKDARYRENDAVLGVVFLKLSDLLVNASELTRFYSLEEGVGYGRIRISILFRAVEAKLPLNLLGFDTGTIEVNDIIVQSNQYDLSKCEVRLKTTTAEVEEKVSRKMAQVQEGNHVVWTSDTATTIPVRQRYSSSLLVSFRDNSGLKNSKRKALGVLWLCDLVDNAEGKVEVPLWRAKDSDYSRLKLNYVPPNGDLGYWDSDKEKVERIGSVWLDIVFRPGISSHHKGMLGGAGAKNRSAWDVFEREEAAGLRHSVGERGDQTHDDEGETTDATAPTGENAAVDSPGGDVKDSASNSTEQIANTFVSTDSVVNECSHSDRSNDSVHGDGQDSGDGGGEKRGVVQKFKDWKQHEKELHRDHRGIMQVKPARTVAWIKDNVEEGAHAMKNQFKMKARQSDVETEG